MTSAVRGSLDAAAAQRQLVQHRAGEEGVAAAGRQQRVDHRRAGFAPGEGGDRGPGCSGAGSSRSTAAPPHSSASAPEASAGGRVATTSAIGRSAMRRER